MEKPTPEKNSETSDCSSVFDLIKTLRGENGCPWDRKQTSDSMMVYLLNEAYELQDAIKSGDPSNILDEAGDVLFQLLFIIAVYTEKKSFDFADVINNNLEKMKRRHPHVFGNIKADTAEKVLENWGKIKEKEREGSFKSIIDSVSAGMPSLGRAYLISEKVGKAGFDWDDMAGVKEKVTEEWAELNEALKENNPENIALEFGDLLFTLANVARFAGIHPEAALASSVNKFEKRYKHMEKTIFESGKELISISRQDIDMLWEQAKKDTK